MSEEVATTYESRMARFRQQWETALPIIKQLVPTHISPERLFSIAVTARQRTPALLECTDISILRALIQAAQLGLDISGAGGKCFLIPFYNSKTKQTECQLQMGYRGLIELARRSGQITAIYGREVFEGDEFAYEDGLVQRLVHRPIIGEGDPGKIIGVWAVAVWANGFRQIMVMSRPQIDAVRKSSKSGDSGPWSTHYGQMALKTAVKRLCKLIPDSVELNRAIEMEDYAEIGEPQPIDIDLGEPVEPAEKLPTRTQSIVADIVKKRGPGRPPKMAPPPPIQTKTNAEVEAEDLESNLDDADFEDDDEDAQDDED